MNDGGPARERSRGIVGLLACWILAALPFAFAADRWSGLSRCALAALPWIAWSGAPRNARERALDAVWETALFLPPIALGAWIDLANGSRARDVATLAAFAVGIGFALGFASRRAGASRAHALAWLALVAFAPLCAGALVLGGAPSFGQMPPWLAWLAWLSPLSWIVVRLPTGAIAAWPFGAFVTCAVLLWIAWRAARTEIEP